MDQQTVDLAKNALARADEMMSRLSPEVRMVVLARLLGQTVCECGRNTRTPNRLSAHMFMGEAVGMAFETIDETFPREGRE